MTDVAERRRLAILDGTARHDLVLPLDATIGEALAHLGLRPQAGREALLEPNGREVSALSRAEDLPDGAVLSYVDLTRPSSSRRRRRRAAGVIDGVGSPWWLVFTVGGLVAAVSLATPAVLPATPRLWLAAVLVCASLVAGGFIALRGDRAVAVAVAAVLTLAFAAGVVAVPALPAASEVLAVFAGLLAAAVVAGVLSVVSRAPALQAALAASAALFLILSAVWGLALPLGLAVASPAAVTLGLAPVALRAVLASLVEVPPGLFIDYGRYQTTRWSVRQQLPEEIHSIGAADARRIVERSTGRMLAATLLLSAAAAAAAPFALPGFDGSDPLVVAGRIALAATTVLALLLGARRFSAPLLRWMPRAAAGVIVVVVAASLIPHADPLTLTVSAGVLLVAGALTAFAIVPAGRGSRSLAWSRTADAFEWLSVALSLPAALLAADAVDILRGLMGA